MKGRGNPIGDVTPSPQPSPVKGEGERVTVNLYFGVLGIRVDFWIWDVNMALLLAITRSIRRQRRIGTWSNGSSFIRRKGWREQSMH